LDLKKKGDKERKIANGFSFLWFNFLSPGYLPDPCSKVKKIKSSAFNLFQEKKEEMSIGD